jgi:hypothetical protein
MDAPSTRAEWLIDAEMRGHTTAETIRYLSDCADYEDELAQRRALPVFLAGACEPWWLTRLKARFGG